MNLHETPSNNVKSAMNILLVEDSVLIRETLMEILSDNAIINFANTASTENEARSLLAQNAYDLLILDIELAVGNGFDVLNIINADDYPFQKPECIILTNHAHPNYRYLAQRLGIKYFYDKSMDFDLAIDTIENLAKKLCSING